MKRVLIFSLAYLPRFVGGAEVAIKEITNRLADRGFEFHLITPRYDSLLPKTEQIGQVTVHRIGFTTRNPSIADLRRFPLYWNKPLFQFLAAWKALRLHWQRPFDITWAMMAQSTGVAAGLFKTLAPSVRYILNLQEGDPPAYIERLMRPFGPLFRRVFTKADVVQSISTFLQDWAVRMGASGRLIVIPNGVDAVRFVAQPTRSERDQWQERLGKRSGDTWLVTISRLVSKNATDVCIQALKSLPETVHLAIAGIGPDEMALKRLTQSLNLESRVRFLGEVDQASVPALLHACDIFVRPSRSEGLGISFLEAMAAGLPVIATQEGGIRDFLFDSVRNPDQAPTGWAVDADQPEHIAAAVRVIIADQEKAQIAVKNAQAMVRERYDWETISERMRRESFLGE